MGVEGRMKLDALAWKEGKQCTLCSRQMFHHNHHYDHLYNYHTHRCHRRPRRNSSRSSLARSTRRRRKAPRQIHITLVLIKIIHTVMSSCLLTHSMKPVEINHESRN